jgi:L-cysteine S-thiosulfotransferase
MNSKSAFPLCLLSGLVLGANCAVAADNAALDKKAIEVIKRDFKEKGIAKLDRLNLDAVQAACIKYSDKPPHEGADGLDVLEKGQMDAVKWPADGKYLGDWKAGEKLAQSGRGLTWTDTADTPNGGNCYNCHQLDPKEISFGTIGPSLTGYGKTRGVIADPTSPASKAIIEYTWGKIWNARAYNACSVMPRAVHKGIITEAQAKDLMALLLDPKSPVNN